MSEKLSEKQKYNIDCRKSHDDETQNQREHIAKLIIFLMLYLFYNANLLKSYKNVKLRFNVIEFVNKINILMYNKSTKQNYKMLKKA